MRNGVTATTIRCRDTPEMRLRTKSTIPNGGVSRPIIMMSTMMTPKCRGSRELACMIGTSTGVRMMMAAVASRKQPTMSRKPMIRSPTTIGSRETLAMPSTMPWVRPARVTR
jgi:hypothetical protein